jgi:hypothetical protein
MKMSHKWKTTVLTSENEVFQILAELYGKHWICRGQSARYTTLFPSIDRKRRKLTRIQKLNFERKSIETFRSNVKFFSNQGEEGAMSDDVIALMVLRHYGVPTRILDWSLNPWKAMYFALEGKPDEDGALWCFDEPLYEIEGKKQWVKWPETTNTKGDFEAGLTAFKSEEPPDWFICCFYGQGFPRQQAQNGAYTMTARFNRDHAVMIEKLLRNSACHHLYIIRSKLKPRILKSLRNEFNIWRGTLYTDSAGAAETAKLTNE